jgi:hypothetical protein
MKRKRILFMAVFAAVLALSVGLGTVAADSPNCSNVGYAGSGNTGDPYKVTTVDELQCIRTNHSDADSLSDALNDDYELVNDIDASGTSSWNGGDGFEPIYNGSHNFRGTFDGNGYTVTGLTIDRRSTSKVGLFGEVKSESSIENVGLEDVDVTGRGVVGGLVGYNLGTVDGSYVTGSVSSSITDVGGLVGGNHGTVTGSYATVNVSGGSGDVGGLLGYNDGDGSVTESYATGNVSGSFKKVGGLIGDNFGTVKYSYATGNVSGSHNQVGGLVGKNDANTATVKYSYATGDVSSSDDRVGGLIGYNQDGTVDASNATGNVSGSEYVGGLVGFNDDGTVNRSYATGDVSGSDSIVGGLVGRNRNEFDNGTVKYSYATGVVSGPQEVGGLVGFNDDTVTGSYATGNVSGSSDVGGLVGINFGAVDSSYWDTETTEQSTSEGGLGLNTSEMVGTAAVGNMTDFEFTNIWDVQTTGNESYPFLQNNTQTPPPKPEVETELFTQALIDTFSSPPTNTGELNPTLYEDLSGDGDGKSVAQTVTVFGELIRGNDLGLTDEQAKKFNWNEDSPGTKVTVADMVTLFGKQIRAG